MTIKWATKLRKGTRKNDRNKFAEKGRIFLLKRMKGTKKKNKSELFTSQKYFPIGQLHDDVILLQLPESLSLLFSCAN